MECVHLLKTDICPPERFTYPFAYEPHPLCQLAAQEVQAYIAGHEVIREDADKGKMFGVLVVSPTAAQEEGSKVTLQAPLPLGGDGGGLISPCPSLFSFRIDDEQLHTLMGIVTEATAMIPGTKLRACGPLLITHWGMSGPAILRLSSYGARLLHDNQYRLPLSVNWTNAKPDEVLTELQTIAATHPQKLITNIRPYGLTSRLWEYITKKALGGRSEGKWLSLNKKEMNRLSNVLTNDEYQIAGRAPFKDEFVTCGGVSLKSINPTTLECKTRPGLYFAGEVIDIDGVTGGFNFQAAWTTAYVVAKSIEKRCEHTST